MKMMMMLLMLTLMMPSAEGEGRVAGGGVPAAPGIIYCYSIVKFIPQL